MQGRIALTAAAFVAAILFAGCGSSGGGGSNSNLPPPNNNPSPVPTSTPNLAVDPINAANAAGSPVADDQDLETANMSPGNGGGGAPNGKCLALPSGQGGYKFTVSTNSTERMVFSDALCQNTVIDSVRTFAAGTGAGTETVTRNITRYASDGSQQSTRVETINYSNGTFDQYGYPTVDTGLVRESNSTFNFKPHTTNAFTITQNDEFIVGTASPLTFCADNAGVNAKGTFGFQTQSDPSANSTITTDSSNNTTFTMVRDGLAFSTSGGLLANTGTLNTKCPIAAPAYFISGASGAAYTLPISVTISGAKTTAIPPVIDIHTTAAATFPHGETLTITTQNSMTSSATFTGTLKDGSGNTIATFTMDVNGNGQLNVPGYSSTPYPISNWHVVH